MRQGEQLDAIRSRFSQYRTPKVSTDPVRAVQNHLTPECGWEAAGRLAVVEECDGVRVLALEEYTGIQNPWLRKMMPRTRVPATTPE